MNHTAIHECSNCKNQFPLLFSTDANGNSLNVENCPVCEASPKHVKLAKEQ